MVTKTTAPKDRYLKLIDAALNLQQAGEHERALDILLKAKEDAPDYAPIYLLLGVTFQAMKRLDEAEASLRQALALESKYPEALQTLGLLLAARNRLDEAILLLKDHLAGDAGNPVSLKALTAALLRARRPEEAVDHLRDTWLKLQAEEPGVQLGRLLIQLNRRQPAEEVLREVALKLPSPRSLSEWALALFMLEHYEDAVRALQQAVEMDATFDRAWRGLAQCYQRLGQLPQALEVAERALSLNNGHYRNWEAKADVLLSMEKYQEALEAAQHGVQLVDPGDTEARPVLSVLWRQECQSLLELGQVQEALKRLQDTRHRLPSEEIFGFQAWLLSGQGRNQDALQILDEARQAGIPDNSNLAPLRYQLLHMVGRPDEAWASMRPQLDVERQRRLETLGQIGVMLYMEGQVAAARAIFSQLHEFAPEDSRVACNLGFVLIGEGDLAQAAHLLHQAIQSPESADCKPIAFANLGYLSLIEQKYPDAQHYLDTAAQAEGEAILRVAYWRDGHIMPEYTGHPRQALPIQAAVKANRVTLMLASGQTDEAETLARQLVESGPDMSLGYKMLGWMSLAAGKLDEARQSWQQALERSSDPLEQQALSGWLDALPQ